jgi:hypothetical protein
MGGKVHGDVIAQSDGKSIDDGFLKCIPHSPENFLSRTQTPAIMHVLGERNLLLSIVFRQERSDIL